MTQDVKLGIAIGLLYAKLSPEDKDKFSLDYEKISREVSLNGIADLDI